jgi:hypothetical protein
MYSWAKACVSGYKGKMFDLDQQAHPHVTVKTRLTETIQAITHLREDLAKIRDPKARQLFDTTREVLKDLVAAFDLYERRSRSPL